ncbi:MAG: hypothetical protein ACJ790_05130 [Myxococcaceae bacterium]
MVSLLLAILLSAPAASSPELTDAVTLYESAEFQKALPKLQALSNDAALSHPDRVLALEYLAATHYALNDENAARADLSALVAFDDSAQLDELVFNPNLRAIHEALRTKALAEKAKSKVEPAPVPVVEAPPPPPAVRTVKRSAPLLSWASVASGAVLAGAGAFEIVAAQNRQSEWKRNQASGERLSFSKSTAQLDQTLYPMAWAGAGLGAALLGYGVYGLLNHDDAAAVSLSPTVDGARFVVSGRF